MTWWNPFSWFRREPDVTLELKDMLLNLTPTPSPFMEQAKPKYTRGPYKKGSAVYKGCAFSYPQLAALSPGLNSNLIMWRVRNGWSVEEAVETPNGVRRRTRLSPAIAPEPFIHKHGWPD